LSNSICKSHTIPFSVKFGYYCSVVLNKKMKMWKDDGGRRTPSDGNSSYWSQCEVKQKGVLHPFLTWSPTKKYLFHYKIIHSPTQRIYIVACILSYIYKSACIFYIKTVNGNHLNGSSHFHLFIENHWTVITKLDWDVPCEILHKGCYFVANSSKKTLPPWDLKKFWSVDFQESS
jgi:hypothetical protein